MVSNEPEANTQFVDGGLFFYDAQSAPFQAELVVVATRLYHEPAIDNEQKFWMKVQGRFQAQQLIRIFRTDEYWLYYEVGTDDDGRDCLFVRDGGFYH